MHVRIVSAGARMRDGLKGDLEQILSILRLAELLPECTVLMKIQDKLVDVVLRKVEVEGIHHRPLRCQRSMRQLQVKHLQH